jgi:urease accessory protein
MRAFSLFLLAVLVPTGAFAHAGQGDASGLVQGLLHPVGGIDHVLAMVTVGIFAVVLGGRALWLVPLSFVAMMAAGFLLGSNGVAVPFVELGLALSSVIIGGAAAFGKPKLPVAGAMALVGGFAIFHGQAHGAEMPADATVLLYALGIMAATALVHLAGIATALGVARRAGTYGQTAARMAGGMLALGGIGALTGWL